MLLAYVTTFVSWLVSLLWKYFCNKKLDGRSHLNSHGLQAGGFEPAVDCNNTMKWICHVSAEVYSKAVWELIHSQHTSKNLKPKKFPIYPHESISVLFPERALVMIYDRITCSSFLHSVLKISVPLVLSDSVCRFYPDHIDRSFVIHFQKNMTHNFIPFVASPPALVTTLFSDIQCECRLQNKHLGAIFKAATADSHAVISKCANRFKPRRGFQPSLKSACCAWAASNRWAGV